MAAITITEIQLFNVLKKKLGEQEAEQLVGFVQSEIKEEVKRKSETLATKEDLAKMESKLILWAFVFWATQLGAMFAFLKLFIAKYTFSIRDNYYQNIIV
jgi:hypothetical protein